MGFMWISHFKICGSQTVEKKMLIIYSRLDINFILFINSKLYSISTIIDADFNKLGYLEDLENFNFVLYFLNRNNK